MSYIKKRGEDAAKAALESKKDFSEALLKFKSGTTHTVRFASDSDYVMYDAVSIYQKIHTTPVVEGNLYEKASKLLYEEAEQETNEKKKEEIEQLAGQLRPRQRYLFAFFDLETGKPAVLDVTKNQANAIVSGIKKFSKKIDDLAFEISKSGSGQSTVVSVTPVIDEDDLTKEQKKHFAETKGKKIDDDIYDILYMRDQDEQVEDLQKVGFDISKLGIEITQSDNEDYDL